MYLVLLIFHLIVSLLLIGVVLLQSGKGASLSNIFGGGGMETVFGAETSIILNRITSILAIIFIISSILLATLPGKLTTKSILQQEIQNEQPIIPPVSPELPEN
ncbi:MAG: preprotein translocase subunit SecG [Candidatus Omnitrophica bacterium]|nr:preprotein translocase subunit SecG [Candidatus Omnitrophota bacterium]MCM8776645.1 preprotein translocase subunit SecG [Candidatus Omnitrophota bacterium]